MELFYASNFMACLRFMVCQKCTKRCRGSKTDINVVIGISRLSSNSNLASQIWLRNPFLISTLFCVKQQHRLGSPAFSDNQSKRRKTVLNYGKPIHYHFQEVMAISQDHKENESVDNHDCLHLERIDENVTSLASHEWCWSEQVRQTFLFNSLAPKLLQE